MNSSCCAKAVRQLNALSRLSKNLDPKCRKLIFESYVLSNFAHCPIVWHFCDFCGQQNNGKIEKKIFKNGHCGDNMMTTSMNIANSLINQGPSPCCSLDWMVSYSRSIHNARHLYIQIKKSSYSMRDSSKLVQLKRNTTTYGFRSFTYFWSKLWNDFPSILTHWPLGNLGVILKIQFSILFLWRVSAVLLMLIPSGESYWWWINISSGNGLVPSGNKPLPEPMLTQISVAIWRH